MQQRSTKTAEERPEPLPILTVTLNAAIDTTVTLNGALRVGEAQHAASVLRLAGGKGLNVARVLRTLALPALATGLLGGVAGESIREGLQKAGVAEAFYSVAGESRTNVALVDEVNHQVTEVNVPGPMISDAEADGFLAHLTQLSVGVRAVTISGSLPRIRPSIYAECVAAVHSSGIATFLDASGAALRAALEARPWMVKINAVEASELSGQRIQSVEDAVGAAHSLLQRGITLVSITLGSRGAVLVTTDHAWHAYLAVESPLSAVGSGDSFLAGFVGTLWQHSTHGTGLFTPDQETLALALRVATACGAANTLSLGAGVLTLENVRTLQPQVSVQELNHR